MSSFNERRNGMNKTLTSKFRERRLVIPIFKHQFRCKFPCQTSQLNRYYRASTKGKYRRTTGASTITVSIILIGSPALIWLCSLDVSQIRFHQAPRAKWNRTEPKSVWDKFARPEMAKRGRVYVPVLFRKRVLQNIGEKAENITKRARNPQPPSSLIQNWLSRG